VSDRSSGAFDITVGPLARLWGFHDKKPHVPSDLELQAVKPLVDYRNLLLDEVSHTIRFARPGVEIDLGGIAKGFAVELAANVLKRHGLAGFIDAGGNQYMLGLPPGKSSWTVGVRDPDRADALIGTIDSPGGSVSTSAGYATFLTGGGKRYGHIMDPRALHPSDACLSVTTIAPDGTLADAVSTAAFVLGPERGLALIDSFPDMTGLIVYRAADGKVAIVMSKSLEGRFHRMAASPRSLVPGPSDSG
jgi:thiamine biosynthesis lipoprotein